MNLLAVFWPIPFTAPIHHIFQDFSEFLRVFIDGGEPCLRVVLDGDLSGPVG
jgi:hypothetical protein